MKKMVEDRYPHSATLFRFCKEALSLRNGGQVKVIDQDVGALLSFDPADCSHWKKGKKNIRALDTLRLLATHFQINEDVIIDIVSGRIGLDEALLDLNEYRTKNVEASPMKVPYEPLRRKAGAERGVVRPTMIKDLVDLSERFAELLQFSERTLTFRGLPGFGDRLRVEASPDLDSVIRTIREDDRIVIRFRGHEWEGYTRFMVIREVFKILCHEKHDWVKAFHHIAGEELDASSHLFALHVLVPSLRFQQALPSLDVSRNLVEQLSKLFLLPKTLMNQRLLAFLS